MRDQLVFEKLQSLHSFIIIADVFIMSDEHSSLVFESMTYALKSSQLRVSVMSVLNLGGGF